MRTIPAVTLLVCAVLTLPSGGILADSPAAVPDQVEEDWELVIESPDVSRTGPQITTTMSPNQDNSTFFVAFNLNYRDHPTFQPGGMQIQAWKDKEIAATSSQASGQFSTPNETVTWTQRMSVDGSGSIQYQVTNGQSTTWGPFGQSSGSFQVSCATSLTALSGYSAAYSADHSAVTWQSNRVTSLKLVRVRYYAAGQLVSTDTTPRPVKLGS